MNVKLYFLLPPLMLLSVLLPSAPPALAQRQRLDFTELEKVALEELKQTKTPGAAVAIISGDHIAFAKGLGVSSIETGIPVTPNTLFRVGSVTKMFTAAVLVALAGREESNSTSRSASTSKD